MAEIYWDSKSLQAESLRVDASDPMGIYAKLIDKDKTNDFFSIDLRMKAISKTNLILLWIGDPGTGKSYAAMYVLGRFCILKGLEPDIKNVAFSITDCLDRVEKVDRGDMIILDEQIRQFGLGSSVERALMDNIVDTVRAHKLCFFFLSPRYIGHTFHYMCETRLMGSDKPWDYARPIEQQWKYTKNLLFDSKERLLGYIITGKPSSTKFLKFYEKKKDTFVSSTRKRRGGGRYLYRIDKALSLLKKRDFLEKWIQPGVNKSLREDLVRVYSGGEIFGTEEIKAIISRINYSVRFDPKLKKWNDRMLELEVMQKMREDSIKKQLRKRLL